MEARARRHARIPLLAERLPSIPDLVGCEGSTLVIKRTDPSAAGPPDGAVSSTGRWVSGEHCGDAEIVLLPLWSWGAEVHVALAPPNGLGRLRWSAGRLDRLAERLTAAVVDALSPAAEETREAASAAWVTRPAQRARGRAGRPAASGSAP